MIDIIQYIRGMYDGYKKVQEIADGIKNQELSELILEYRKQLVDLEHQCVGVISENAQLKWDILQLKEELRKQLEIPEVEIKDGLYFRKTGEGPFCTGCKDGNNKLITLSEVHGHERPHGKWKCPICANYYGKGSFGQYV